MLSLPSFDLEKHERPATLHFPLETLTAFALNGGAVAIQNLKGLPTVTLCIFIHLKSFK